MKDNEDISRIKVEPTEAFKRFKDEVLSSENIDFSDKLGRSLKTGYKSKYIFTSFFFLYLLIFINIIFNI
jgi:hypothetical protein